MTFPEKPDHLRRLPTYLLDILEPEERTHIESALRENKTLREALEGMRTVAESWREGDHPVEETWSRLGRGELDAASATPAFQHLLSCRDCRFAAAVVLAGEEAAGSGRSGPGEERRRGRRVGPVLGLAAGLALGVLGFGLGSRTGGPEASRTAVLNLDAVRGDSGEPVAALSVGDGVTLVVETNFPPTSGRWRVMGVGNREVVAGELRFPGNGPTLRSLAIHLPAARLEPGAFVLQLRSEDGSVDRQWRFRLQ